MADEITIKECISRLDAIRDEINPNSRNRFALSAGIAALYGMQKDSPAANRWIPCSERLPEYGEYVLFIRENCEVYVGYYDEKNTWSTDYQWFIGENVTHWMPMPEPPEKE